MSSNEPNIAQKLAKKLKNMSKLIFYIIALLIIIIVCFLVSEGYRVNKCIRQMDIYRNYLVINSIFSDKKIRNKKLRDFYVASSFRSCTCLNQRFDYINVELLSMTLQSGARFIWLDIFNDKMSPGALPVISVGKDEGNYRYSLNTIYFEEAIEKIAKIAFNPGYVTNYNDPLILALNLNVQKNIATLNIVKRNIIKHLLIIG